MKPTKYLYLYVLQGQYGHGWEDIAAEDMAPNRALARRRIAVTQREYCYNEGGVYRVVRRRELRNEG